MPASVVARSRAVRHEAPAPEASATVPGDRIEGNANALCAIPF